MSLTVIIPTLDEELHLGACLESVVGWSERVIVLDSGSTDRTRSIATRHASQSVEFVEHEYAGPADQKNWALDALDIDTEWVMFLDADERIPKALQNRIVEATATPSNKVSGYFINRKIIWYGKWIRFGGWYPNWNLRLFRFGKARYHMRRVHEHMVVDGPVEYMEPAMIHEDLRDLSHCIAKHNRYSTSEASEYAECRQGEQDAYARFWTRDVLARRRWIKTRVWARLPAKGVLYFLWAYFIRLGFLDGMLGLRYHAMHAIYKHFDEMKVWELENYKIAPEDRSVHIRPTYWQKAEAEQRDSAA